ncbi:septal ring lytic transglycosylase RlpA family protein [Pseudorhodoferax sp. Leaf267]|uniref:septal ring lytic transglycosylase RlpA family protein n=1 Tax=Pseudorhodoferax sp. Leaf267 TaxID=1736316 RepID=UPI0007130B90|nr:septal ring lytic transglycosylase RlpA family protein [Pseudorhodoferax sp. Leaf267]KQP13173.1 hypothetical protein ASF43_18900 [Pseudorhodoferax sp. Leaf267]
MPMRLAAIATVFLLLFAWALPARAEEPAAAPSATPHVQHGRLSYYSHKLAGRKTASGEPFDPQALTMAHKTLPFGTLVRVTNPRNQRSVVVRVNDRGPWSPWRVGDVSLAAARELGITARGVVDARLEVVATAE